MLSEPVKPLPLIVDGDEKEANKGFVDSGEKGRTSLQEWLAIDRAARVRTLKSHRADGRLLEDETTSFSNSLQTLLSVIASRPSRFSKKPRHLVAAETDKRAGGTGGGRSVEEEKGDQSRESLLEEEPEGKKSEGKTVLWKREAECETSTAPPAPATAITAGSSKRGEDVIVVEQQKSSGELITRIRDEVIASLGGDSELLLVSNKTSYFSAAAVGMKQGIVLSWLDTDGCVVHTFRVQHVLLARSGGEMAEKERLLCWIELTNNGELVMRESLVDRVVIDCELLSEMGMCACLSRSATESDLARLKLTDATNIDGGRGGRDSGSSACEFMPVGRGSISGSENVVGESSGGRIDLFEANGDSAGVRKGPPIHVSPSPSVHGRMWCPQACKMLKFHSVPAVECQVWDGEKLLETAKMKLSGQHSSRSEEDLSPSGSRKASSQKWGEVLALVFSDGRIQIVALASLSSGPAPQLTILGKADLAEFGPSGTIRSLVCLSRSSVCSKTPHRSSPSSSTEFQIFVLTNAGALYLSQISRDNSHPGDLTWVRIDPVDVVPTTAKNVSRGEREKEDEDDVDMTDSPASLKDVLLSRDPVARLDELCRRLRGSGPAPSSVFTRQPAAVSEDDDASSSAALLLASLEYKRDTLCRMETCVRLGGCQSEYLGLSERLAEFIVDTEDSAGLQMFFAGSGLLNALRKYTEELSANFGQKARESSSCSQSSAVSPCLALDRKGLEILGINPVILWVNHIAPRLFSRDDCKQLRALLSRFSSPALLKHPPLQQPAQETEKPIDKSWTGRSEALFRAVFGAIQVCANAISG